MTPDEAEYLTASIKVVLLQETVAIDVTWSDLTSTSTSVSIKITAATAQTVFKVENMSL